MSRKLFTEEQLNILRQNPYVYSVTASQMALTKEFKEAFMAAYNAGEMPRKILEDHGFDIGILGNRRVWSISCHIRAEYSKYGEFHEGYSPRNRERHTENSAEGPLSDKEELKQLRRDVEYLRQEVDFLKKISSIRAIGK